MSELKITDFIFHGNTAMFDSFRCGVFYYLIPHKATFKLYQFQIPLEDIGGVTLNCKEKSVTLMRWVRKSIENGTFIKQ